MRMILTTFTVVTMCATAALAADAKAGQAVYDKSCKSCHGADGTPNAGHRQDDEGRYERPEGRPRSRL